MSWYAAIFLKHFSWQSSLFSFQCIICLPSIVQLFILDNGCIWQVSVKSNWSYWRKQIIGMLMVVKYLTLDLMDIFGRITLKLKYDFYLFDMLWMRENCLSYNRGQIQFLSIFFLVHLDNITIYSILRTKNACSTYEKWIAIASLDILIMKRLYSVFLLNFDILLI